MKLRVLCCARHSPNSQKRGPKWLPPQTNFEAPFSRLRALSPPFLAMAAASTKVQLAALCDYDRLKEKLDLAVSQEVEVRLSMET